MGPARQTSAIIAEIHPHVLRRQSPGKAVDVR